MLKYTHIYKSTSPPFKLYAAEGRWTRGHEFKVETVRPRTNIRKHSFRVRVTKDWNNLPHILVTAPSLNTFKNRLVTSVMQSQDMNTSMIYNFWCI
jgi:hypothetical protein